LEALAMIPEVEPEVICTDLHMPQMDGLVLTMEVMDRYPRPILVVSASVQEDDSQHVFQLLSAGAVDIFPKPVTGLRADNATLNDALINKIRILSGVKVFRKKQQSAPAKPLVLPQPARTTSRIQLVTVGASTGGPQALHTLFSQLPKDFPPVLCVQHISTGFLQGLIDWLQKGCLVSLEIAQSNQRPQPGRIYFPPEDHHLTLNKKGEFVYLDLPPVEGHCPSITVTFDAVAQYYRHRAVGILLTGMGRDGALGMQSIAQAGGLTIAQDEESCVVFGMPKVAIDLGAAKQVLPIGAIAPALLKLVYQSAYH
ncbi:MAG: response regulator, partial [Leptolyngbya sp. SIO4C1]|nr:response regulator [Leptolyngbya sp. SIO4C1]